jgi:hypothetical protein
VAISEQGEYGLNSYGDSLNAKRQGPISQ